MAVWDRGWRRWFGSLLLATISFPSNVGAQDEGRKSAEPVNKEAPVRAAKVRNPEPIDTHVDPIAGQWSTAEVVLSLVIDAEGRVTSAKLVSGTEPFSGAALRAAPHWKFSPARRGEDPVASKIHFLVVFEPRQTPEELPPEEEGEASDEKPQEQPALRPAAEASGQALEEVVVYGKIPDPGSTELTRAEVKNLAGAFGDPLRSVEVMPGVTPIVSGLPLFFVRGAPPGNVGFYIDGIRVPMLYHAFLGPSVIHPQFIDKVSLNGGPMPARFGRIAGASVEAELAQPEGVRRAEATVRLFDAGVFAEAPINDGKGYALLGGRYSYTALLVSAFAPDTRLDYWDYQALVGHSLGRKDEISVLGMGAFDFANAGDSLLGFEFHRADLRWDHQFSKDTNFRLAFTYGSDRSRSDSGFVTNRLTGSRFNFEHRSKQAVFRSGGDIWAERYSLELDPAIAEPETFVELFPTRTDANGGLWMDVVLFPKGRIQVIPGIRGDVFSSLGNTLYSVDPRLFASYRLTKKLRATHGIGVSHQSPNFVPSVPGAQVGGLDGGLQRSLHASTEYEADLFWSLTGSIGFFLNGTERLTDPIGLTQTFAFDETSAETRAQGRSMGVELYLKRPLTRHLGGLLSYTFSRTERSRDFVRTLAGFDRTHVFNGALTYDFGHHIRASAKIAFASGLPGRRAIQVGGSDGAASHAFRDSRSAPYIRADLKVAKKWYVSEHFNWGLHLEALNATYSRNVTRRECNVDGCEDEGNAPLFLPSLGVEANWQ